MTRTWIAIVAAACLGTSVVSAQAPHLTVSTATATVHKSPSTASPVIGQASRGTTLEVTRDVGDWVKVAWSTSPDGVGYVRKSAGAMGTLSPAGPVTPAAASVSPVRPTSTTASASAAQANPTTTPRAASTPGGPDVRPQSVAVPAGSVAIPSHRIGFGGQVGGAAMGGGFSVRGWTTGRLGYQFDVVRYSMSNPVIFTQMSSTQVGPKVLYTFGDHVTDRTWLRPYVGAGAHVLRATLTDPVTATATSDSRVAPQFFGGTEATLSSVPQLGLSMDLGYQWYQNPFGGYSLNGVTVAATAHWYLK